MKPRLFLTGPSGCGKSTMIRRELGDLAHRAGGFRTLRERSEDGRICGFVIGSADGYGPKDRFLDLTGEKPRIDLEIFSGVGLDYLRRAPERQFALLDEVGGVELLNEQFMDAFARYLQGSQPCIGVMKGPGPAGKLVEMMGLAVRYELARRALYDFLDHELNTTLIEMTGPEDENALTAVHSWVEEYAQ